MKVRASHLKSFDWKLTGAVLFLPAYLKSIGNAYGHCANINKSAEDFSAVWKMKNNANKQQGRWKMHANQPVLSGP